MGDQYDSSFPFVLLAQENATGLPGDASAQPATGADGSANGGPGAAAPASPGFGDSFLFLIIGAVVLMFVMSMFGQRKERKKRDAMLAAIKKHDTVQTVGGVIGAVVEVKPDIVVLKVDESSNTRVTFARSSIQQVVSSG
jgi:preprotein translocase YajC subunit